MKRYRKKPVEIESFQYFCNEAKKKELIDFVGIKNLEILRPLDERGEEIFYIKTPEGNMKVSCGDYIVKGIKREFYPCKPEIFEEIYEEIKD